MDGDQFTPNFNLVKPDVGASDDTWGEKLNSNFDILDAAVAAVGGLPPEEYVTESELTAILDGYISDAEINTILADYVTEADLSAALASYVTTAAFPEMVDDRVAAFLVAGSNITLTHNDPANTLTIDSTGGGGGVPATEIPLVEAGTGAVGVSLKYAREDHVHPLGPGGGGGASVLVSDTPPAGAADNSLWWESDTGILYVRYYDGSSTQWVAIAGGFTDAVRYGVAQTLTANQQAQARANIGSLSNNLIINGDFRVNQRVYVSAAVLAFGVYGHDRWKAGSGGGDYSFAQLVSSTQITIAANKTLIQIIEDRNVEGGNYVLSWTGTCQARVGLNSATPSGSYASSPVTITGQTVGTVMSVEFGNGASSGTLGKVKLEIGSVATPFAMTAYADESIKCQRYLWAFNPSGGAQRLGVVFADTTTTGQMVLGLPVPLRASPTITLSGIIGTPTPPTAPSPYGGYGPGNFSIGIGVTTSGATVGVAYQLLGQTGVGNYFRMDAEL